MHFGRLNATQKFDASLPPDTERTRKFLALERQGGTQFYIGCPIWAERKWVGKLYPKGTKQSAFLAEYAKVFNTVEVNSTFYHLLDGERLTQWREQVPAQFRFCPKVFRGITEGLGSSHMPQLIKQYCDAISAFGDNLGIPFAQLPETFTPAYSNLLGAFVRRWPKEFPLAIELRHSGWFHDHGLIDEAVNFFYRNNISAVITDTPGKRDVLHLSLTQPKVMIRFQGVDSLSDDQVRLKFWVERLSNWAAHALSEIYFFTHQPTEAHIPESALFFQKELSALRH